MIIIDNNVTALSLNGVIKRYAEFTLGPIDTDISAGTVVGLIGPIFSGKTTTINTIAGLIRYETGEVKIFGTPNSVNDPSWKFNIGYVGDQHVFYENTSCRANLNFLS